MRILVVEVNYEYKNPMYRQFYTNFASCMEVDFFGPGYVSRECLEKGVNAYLDKNDRYDAVVLGTYFAYSAEIHGTRYDAYSVHRYTIPYYKVNDAYQCCGKVYEELMHIKGVVKIFVYNEDTFSMPDGDKNMCLKLKGCGFYILSWPIEYLEKYHASFRRLHSSWTGCAYELAGESGDKYIPIPLHGIGYNEIFAGNFYDREYDWCVPGNRAEVYYPERKKAHEMIAGRKKKVWDDDPFQMLSVVTIRREHMEWYRFRNKPEKLLSWIWGKSLGIASYPKMQYIAACREQYLESMRSSRLVYAEGGVGNIFVRKYFEAGASGAVLVAKKVPGMGEMGFVHEKNCIIVDKYKDISGIDGMYDERQLEKIAKAGQKLIIDKHMFTHRASALRETIAAIASGRYKGAFWKDGNYILKEMDISEARALLD